MGKGKLFYINKGIYKEYTFDEVYDLYTPFVKSCKNRVTNSFKLSIGDEEELIQELYMALYKSYKEYDIRRRTSFGQYAKVILTNQCYLYLRSIKKKNSITEVSLEGILRNSEGKEYDNIELSEDNTENIAEQLELKDKMKTLTEYEKNILYDRYIKELTETQMAKKYHTSQCSISRTLKRINNILREEIIYGERRTFRKSRK